MVHHGHGLLHSGIGVHAGSYERGERRGEPTNGHLAHRPAREGRLFEQAQQALAPAAERPASTPSTTSTVHSIVTPRAIQPMMMEAFTYPKEPAVKLPVRPWYTSTNTGRITMTVNSRIADMTHSSAAG